MLPLPPHVQLQSGEVRDLVQESTDTGSLMDSLVEEGVPTTSLATRVQPSSCVEQNSGSGVSLPVLLGGVGFGVVVGLACGVSAACILPCFGGGGAGSEAPRRKDKAVVGAHQTTPRAAGANPMYGNPLYKTHTESFRGLKQPAALAADAVVPATATPGDSPPVAAQPPVLQAVEVRGPEEVAMRLSEEKNSMRESLQRETKAQEKVQRMKKEFQPTRLGGRSRRGKSRRGRRTRGRGRG